jgi:tRNA-modifying protein YgfZ
MSAPARLDRSLIRVSGPEAVTFLQNVLTQDLDGQGDGVRYAALLSPQGKVIADMFVWGADDSVIIETDPTRSADLLRRLSMYKLRAQATLENVSATLAVMWSAEAFDGASVDPRLAALGWRKVVSATEASGDASASFDAVRLEAGVPDLARDAAAEEVFALEALLEELNGVAFQKGCFVGQENASRMKRRATTRKKFCPITFDGAPPAHGAVVRAGEAELGSVRTGATGHALALLRLDRALAALAQGQTLRVDDREVRLDPPAWLLLPSNQDARA